MDQIVHKIVLKMIAINLISEEEADDYCYGVQILLEKSISYAVILLLAVLSRHLIEVVLFLVSFSLLRKHSGGIHCRRFATCFITSIGVSLSGVAFFPFVEEAYSSYQGGGDTVNDNCCFDWRCQQPKYKMVRLRVQKSEVIVKTDISI